MKRIALFNLFLAVFYYLNAQTPPAKDVETIKNLCGCFEVGFKFKETFAYKKDYKIKEAYETGALEWVSYEPQTDGSVKLQHILIIDSSTIIKHWREDWSYENKDIYKYDKNYHWTKVSLPTDKVKGTWTQKVFEVDDRPQYDGVATFAYFDGNTLWQSTVDAPLPRREYSKRSDYNVMNRGNRLYISPKGYMHEQDNKKIIRTTNIADTLLAEEKGYNEYTRVDNSQCKFGIDWWEKNKVFWYDVRSVWNEILPTLPDLAIQQTVDNQKLHERLFKLNEEYISAKKYNSKNAKVDILKAIKAHLLSK